MAVTLLNPSHVPLHCSQKNIYLLAMRHLVIIPIYWQRANKRAFFILLKP